MAVSQKQIAERLGVSIALVSRVLSGKAKEVGIAEPTIKRVLETAQEMGYVPSAAALTLKGKATRTIGVVVYDFQDPFFGAIIEQLQAQAHLHNYSLVLAGFKERHPEASDLAPLHKHAIDGVIILGSDKQADWLGGFATLPVARIGHGSETDPGVRIAIDEDDAARQLLDHIATRGGNQCTFIGAALFSHALRFQALESAARQKGMALARHSVGVSGFKAGLAATRALLADAPETPALLCATDTIAMGALHALHDAGVARAVTGFDDIPGASQFIPPITTVRQPIEEMAKLAFQSVVEPAEPGEMLLKGNLIVRSSS